MKIVIVTCSTKRVQFICVN